MWKAPHCSAASPSVTSCARQSIEASLLGAVLKRLAWNVVVVGFVRLSQVGRVGEGDRAFRAHPVQGGARIEAARECDADSLADGNTLEDGCHAISMIVDRMAVGVSVPVVLVVVSIAMVSVVAVVSAMASGFAPLFVAGEVRLRRPVGVENPGQQREVVGETHRVVDDEVGRRRVDLALRRVVENASGEIAGKVDVDIELLAAPVCVTE